ncbi:MAG: NAD(P)-dependent alcohol dehydrogenase [Gloeomargarita sp. SKYBB_i_bin120]|nr:NAD(P)-dependent alcohol dehydrogenase [Gloeomargarita sp. SKYB120]MDW8179181.1 NAD(P)-dependent alcohol dehydrogenase [Gloeomargarita sp. SKYBB_i_bin120]
MIHAYAAHQPGGTLEPFTYDPGPLPPDAVELQVEYCGICHSDLSMVNNEWGISQYPLVPGHEVVGVVAAVGAQVTSVQVGQRVGLGWYAHSCLQCEWCQTGNQHLCQAAEATIVGRYGGFADRVRAHPEWLIPLPDGLDPAKAGPLFCGGITVFSPLVEFNVRPTDRMGVVGIGGLGHLALQFFRAWGCEVTAFSSNPAKETEAKTLGASHFVPSRDPEALAKVANTFDFILVTANVALPWDLYLQALRPKGRLHFVGVVPQAIPVPTLTLIAAQKSVSGSPVGSPATMRQMLDFAVRHGIEPRVQMFPFHRVNEAMAHLASGQARYRLVLHHER